MSTATTTGPARSAGPPAPDTAITGIPFGRLIRVEWTKATGTRAARWLLALVAASTTALMLRPLLAPSSTLQSHTGYLETAAVGLAILLPVVSILTLTSEWSQRTVLTTFTQEPRRTRVVTAKVAVSMLLAACGAAFGGLVTALALVVAGASGRAIDADLGTGAVVGYLLFVLLNVLGGVAFGALLHNSAAAISLYFVLPTAFGLLGMALASAAEWFDSSTTFGWVLAGDWSGHTPQILVTATVWVVLPLAAGLVRTVRREIR
jgi:ABC-type transport system involved in multi-copper enzyme maturation permease subunit